MKQLLATVTARVVHDTNYRLGIYIPTEELKRAKR